MSKCLCKRVKEDFLKEDLKEYKKLVNSPKYICTKCGRVANEKDNLCKPEKLIKEKK